MNMNIGDLPENELKVNGYKTIDLIAKYFNNIENFDVVPQITPGDIKAKLPLLPPDSPENLEQILNDFESIILPGVTHWNHPMFMAYFNSTSAAPGILAELITAALNSNGMLWKTSPALTELEELSLNWLKSAFGLPEHLFGIIYDTASISTMHAIAAAREYADPDIRTLGFNGKTYTVYTSEHAHSSVEKGAITLGFGMNNVRKIKTDSLFRMDTNELEQCILEDINSGKIPVCVVATIGTTSVTSVDPVEDISAICKKHNIWLHVDSAYAGVTAMLPEKKDFFKGLKNADSIVINPHKWLYTPSDISAFFISKPEILKRAFSIIPEYLKTNDADAVNLMDYGVQLGRRFRALKLWFTIRAFGIEGLKARLRDNIRLAIEFEKWIKSKTNFELFAPVNFSTVCFRYIPNSSLSNDELNLINIKLLESINNSGKALISHSKANNRIFIRIVFSGLRMNDSHLEKIKLLISNAVEAIG